MEKVLSGAQTWREVRQNHSGSVGKIEDYWEKLSNKGINLTLRSEKDFPEVLKEIPWPPFGIYWKGDLSDNRPKVAIVGTRKATPSGLAIAKKFASVLASSGVTVVSGLAFGIDAAAHEGALEAKGKTIAVLAGGLDHVYPRQNERLFTKILDSGGTAVSEHPFGPPAHSGRFIERNRITSGLCLGVVVIEAPMNSGALATARFALEQNREVFVVPGAINQTNYVGSNNLIKSGAALVTSPEEVLESLNLLSLQTFPSSKKNWDFLIGDEREIVAALDRAGSPLSIDKIQELTKMEISAINRFMSLLQIQDIIKEDRGYYSLN